MNKMTSTKGARAKSALRFWDGVRRCYHPDDNLSIAPSLALHRGASDHVDPITYEVLRNSLVGINFEHGALLQQLCVSPVVIFARDFQTALLTETGDLVCMGPNLQYFANCSALVTKWILENRSNNPGIRDGDMWLCNDPFVGCPHQPDTCIAAPIFIDGKLFGWVSNIVHYLDVGGPANGSMNNSARDVWEEAPLFPPMRIVEDRKARDDLIDVFARQSRLSLMVKTDLKAAIASVEAARGKMEGLVKRYGPDVVKAVMRGMIDAGSELLRKRLATIPDGTWSHRAYTEAAVSGDRGLYRFATTVTKKGDVITVSNAGTDKQAGSINLTFGPYSASVFIALTMQLTPELAGAFGGVYRHVVFDLEPGLLTSPDYPAAISPTGGFQAMMAIYCGLLAVGKMVSCSNDSDVRAMALGPNIPHFYGGSAVISQNGKMVRYLGADSMMGSIGATPVQDGVDAGGHIWIPDSLAPNIEHQERESPVLVLYRRYLDGGHDGAGRNRGGRGLDIAVMMHGEGITGYTQFTSNESFVKSQGQWGANTGSRARFGLLASGNARATMAAGRMPTEMKDLEGKDLHCRFKGEELPPMLSGDIFYRISPATAGWGDPLERVPESVARDVAEGDCTVDVARDVYGVILCKDGSVDATGTVARRLSLRTTRLGARPTTTRHAGKFSSGAMRAGECLVVDGHHWHCDCGTRLAPADSNYKKGAKLVTQAIDTLGPGHETDDPEIAGRMEFRAFLCPGCGTRIDTEIAARGDAVIHDICLVPTL